MHDTGVLAQMLLFADCFRDSAGGFILKARAPRREVSTAKAAQMLGVCTKTLLHLRNDPEARRVLKWRPKTHRDNSWLMWDAESLTAYAAQMSARAQDD